MEIFSWFCITNSNSDTKTFLRYPIQNKINIIYL